MMYCDIFPIPGVFHKKSINGHNLISFGFKSINTSTPTNGSVSDPPKTKPSSPKRIDTITGEQLLSQEVESLPCLWGPILPQVGLACLAGGSDTGKSSLLRQLAIACSAGDTSFLDLQLHTRHQSVIYVSTEDDQNATSFLLKRQAKDREPEKLRKLKFFFEPEQLNLELETQLSNQLTDLVIIDCFADIFTSDLKDTQKLRAYLQLFQTLAVKHKCLILFLHHTSKRTEQFEPSKNNLLGGQGFEAKMRLVMELRKDPIDQRLRHLCIVKGNYLSGTFKQESFVLDFDESSLTFHNTGERTPFEYLVKHNTDEAEQKRYDLAKQLKDEGKKYKEIADAIGYGGPSSVTKLFQKAKEKGWDK